jgi:hypothetical protein
LARGKDELILAGIEIYKTPLDTVFRELGKPTEQRQLYPATKEVVGERSYKWKRADISIELGTEYSAEPIFNGNMRETPSSVEVKGTDGDLGHTGRGRWSRPYVEGDIKGRTLRTILESNRDSTNHHQLVKSRVSAVERDEQHRHHHAVIEDLLIGSSVEGPLA